MQLCFFVKYCLISWRFPKGGKLFGNFSWNCVWRTISNTILSSQQNSNSKWCFRDYAYMHIWTNLSASLTSFRNKILRSISYRKLQSIAFQLIGGEKYKTASKQIHESSVLHKSAQLERAQRRCSASARNSSRPWLSSLPSSSSAVAWSETNSPYSQPSNVGLTIVSQVTLSQWKETWTASSLLLALFLANFLFVATFLQIVAMVGLSPQV